MVAALDTVIAHLESYDPALLRSAIPNFFVSRLASEHVKMVLNGEGADEAFAGYGYLAVVDDPAALQRESLRLLSELHYVNLQRLDRMTMAHGLEGRVPFLDVEFLERAMSLDPVQKLHRRDRLEKWPLRAASTACCPMRFCGARSSSSRRDAAPNGRCGSTARPLSATPTLPTPPAASLATHPGPRRRIIVGTFSTSGFLANRCAGRSAASAAPSIRERTVTTMSDLNAMGIRTYSNTVARGLYDRSIGGLRGKHDNVRIHWEDRITRLTVGPFAGEADRIARSQGRKVRVLDLGCGAGQGYELLTRIDEQGLNVEDAPRFVLPADRIGLFLGVDLSEAMVEQGRRNYAEHPGVRFEQADLREGLAAVASEPAFDIYTSSYGSLSHLDGAGLAYCLRDVVRHARPAPSRSSTLWDGTLRSGRATGTRPATAARYILTR